MTAFFDRMRTALGRYQDGVHHLGDPASPRALDALAKRVGPIASEVRDFLRSFDGVELFHETVRIYACGHIQARGNEFIVGEIEQGLLALGEDGALRISDEEGDPIVIGGSIDAFTAAVMAREGLVVGRDGEFLEVFDGGELTTAIRRKRARAGEKADPSSAVWLVEDAELAIEEGEAGRARVVLERAIAVDPRAGSAWALLGALRREARAWADAYHAFASAESRATRTRARRWMEAARAAKEAGLTDEHAAAVRAIEAPLAASLCEDLLAQAEAAYASSDALGAANLAGLVDAVRSNEKSRELAKLARARGALKGL